jgi:hypothetical protein
MTASAPPPNTKQTLIGCLIVAVALMIAAAGMVTLAGIGYGVWRWIPKPGPVDPDDPPIRDATATAAESAIRQVGQICGDAEAEARNRRNPERFIRDELGKRLVSPFDRLNAILHGTSEHQCQRVFKSIGSGFRSGSQQSSDPRVAEYASDLSQNYLDAADTISSNGDFFSLRDRNHAAKERLIEAIAKSRDNQGDPLVGHRQGYLIDDEDKPQLEATSTPLPMTYGGLPMVAKAPPEINPQRWRRVENQHRIGACQGFALASTCEMAYLIASGKVTEFSDYFAYLDSQKKGNEYGRGDCGSTLAGGLKSATESGCCPLQVMPYPAEYTDRFAPGCVHAVHPRNVRPAGDH